MISYLKGTVAGIQKSGGNRVILTEVNSCGYDLQIPARLTQLPATGELIQVFTHLQISSQCCTGLLVLLNAIYFAS